MEPVPLRRRTLPAIVDAGFGVMKRDPRTVCVVVALVALPLSLLQLWVQYVDAGVDSFNPVAQFTPNSNAGNGSASPLLLVISTFIPSLKVTLTAAALAPLMLAHHRGMTVSAGPLIRNMLKRLPAITVAWVVVHLMEFAGVFVVGIGLLVMVLFNMLVIPAMVIGHLGPFQAIGRSFSMVGRGFGRALGVLVLVFLAETIIRWSLVGLPVGLGARFEWAALPVAGVATLASDLLLVPFVACATCALYFDLLVRQAALDLDLRLDAVGAAP